MTYFNLLYIFYKKDGDVERFPTSNTFVPRRGDYVEHNIITYKVIDVTCSTKSDKITIFAQER